jgi:hypothetical protein
MLLNHNDLMSAGSAHVARQHLHDLHANHHPVGEGRCFMPNERLEGPIMRATFVYFAALFRCVVMAAPADAIAPDLASHAGAEHWRITTLQGFSEQMDGRIILCQRRRQFSPVQARCLMSAMASSVINLTAAATGDWRPLNKIPRRLMIFAPEQPRLT